MVRIDLGKFVKVKVHHYAGASSFWEVTVKNIHDNGPHSALEIMIDDAQMAAIVAAVEQIELDEAAEKHFAQQD